MAHTRCLAALLPLVLSLSLSTHAAAQTPDLYEPTVVRDLYLNFSQTNYWAQLLANYTPEINIAATMTIGGVTLNNVGVRFRGNTSYTMLPAGSEKKSFNIETDWQVQGQDLWGYNHLNLNNGFHDPTFLREFLTYMVMRRHGVAPKCNFVRLWLNNVYWGIYINVQQPNKDMMKEWFRSNDGNRYRCFPTSGSFGSGRCAFTWLGSTVATYLQAYQAKQGDGTDLMNMCNVLNNTATAQLQAALRPVFNVDAFYRYAAVMNVMTNTDSYLESGKDHFLYHDEVHGDFTTFPFDLNESMAGSTSLDPWYQTTNTQRPGFTKTLQFPEWRERYKAHLRTIVDQSFNPTFLTPIAQQYHALIAADVAADPKKIYTTAQFTANLNSSVTVSGAGGGTIPGLVPFIQSRSAFLLAHADLSPLRTVLTNLAHTPAVPNPTQSITFTVDATSLAANVKLYFRALGAFQSTAMFDDGLHGDGGAADGTWGVVLAPQGPGVTLDCYVEALMATGRASYLPYTAELEINTHHVFIDWPVTASPIRINEFVAQNVAGIVDEQNQHEDWLELYNTSNLPVNVGGLWLSDNLTQLKWQIPVNTTIAANSTLLVWCDEDGTQGPMHANFKLSAGGEAIGLWAADGLSLHDVIVFGAQVTDVATGRVLDGSTPWATFTPTPYARNEMGACGTRAYRALVPAQNGASLSLSASPQIGTTPNLDLSGGPAGGIGAFVLSLMPDHIDLTQFGVPAEVLLLDPASMVVMASVILGPGGAGSVPLNIPNDPGFIGLRLFGQGVTLATGFDTSNALTLIVCP